jgi:hypothetical protein
MRFVVVNSVSLSLAFLILTVKVFCATLSFKNVRQTSLDSKKFSCITREPPALLHLDRHCK